MKITDAVVTTSSIEAQMVKLDAEQKRTYHFPVGTITVENVTHILVRPSGTHRLTTTKGLWIINPGWLAIEIDADHWTV